MTVPTDLLLSTVDLARSRVRLRFLLKIFCNGDQGVLESQEAWVINEWNVSVALLSEAVAVVVSHTLDDACYQNHRTVKLSHRYEVAQV